MQRFVNCPENVIIAYGHNGVDESHQLISSPLHDNESDIMYGNAMARARAKRRIEVTLYVCACLIGLILGPILWFFYGWIHAAIICGIIIATGGIISVIAERAARR
jgi:hypothetical protein